MDSKFLTSENFRFLLKDSIRKKVDFSATGQRRGLPCPPPFKPYPENAALIRLPDWRKSKSIGSIGLADAMARRKSRRVFLKEPLSLEELSFLLWATQGFREMVNPCSATRTVPSAGCRHSFESYIVVFNVAGLDSGIYRYIAPENSLLLELKPENLEDRLEDAVFGQKFAVRGAVAFVWSTIPERMEWRYGLAAHRAILIDAGHVCQNLYLACESISAGTCAIAAYDQELLDSLLGLDGKTEFAIYAAPVGKVRDA